MKRIAKDQSNPLTDQRGMALFAAFVVLILLTVLGLAGIYLATTDIKISHNYKEIRQRFFTAEAALEQGVNIVQSTSVDNWSNFLTGATITDPEVLISGLSNVSFYGMNYTVLVRNNLDDPVFTDPNYTTSERYSTDKDEILVIIAEARGNAGDPKILETAVQWEPSPENSYGGKDMTADNANVTDANIDWT